VLRRSKRAGAIALGLSASVGRVHAQGTPGEDVPAERPSATPAAPQPEQQAAAKAAPAIVEEAPSEPAATEGVAGHTPDEGFRIKSSDGKYRMRFALTAGFKFEPAWNDGDRALQGALAFVRPATRGNFYQPWLRYAISLELAQEDAYLLGATIEAQPWDEFGARFGQQETPASRHTSFSPAQIFFPDYAAVASYFWSGRQKGLTLFGSAFEGKLDYFAGFYGGAPLRDPVNDPDNYVAEARITASPLGAINGSELPFTAAGESLPTRFSFTLQGYYGELDTSVENFSPTNSILTPEPLDVAQEMATGGGDLWFQTGPLILFCEYFIRHVSDGDELAGFDSHGLWGQGMVDVYEHLIGAGARANYIDPNLDLEDDRVLEFEGQVAWFIHPPELVFKARYAYLRQDSPDAETLGDFELPFIPGTSHVLTFQLTLAL
jgi:hypothetical protein